MSNCLICNQPTDNYIWGWCKDCREEYNNSAPPTMCNWMNCPSKAAEWAANKVRKIFKRNDSQIVIDKEILIDSLCEKFGITEGKMRRAIDHIIKFNERRSELRCELWEKDPLKDIEND